jgi:lactoylglutathione lyase
MADRARRALRAGRHPQGASGHDIAFLHPKANEEFPIAGAGVLIELVQAPPEVIAAYRKGV